MGKRGILPLPSSQKPVHIPAELPLFMEYRFLSEFILCPAQKKLSTVVDLSDKLLKD
jgi:hypothetical protein